MRSQLSGTPLASAVAAGLMTPADKATVTNNRIGMVNLLDYGADPTGANDVSAALAAAQAALPSGGVIFCPPGTYKLAAAFTVTTAGITLLGASRNNTAFVTSSATADIFVVNQWFVAFENLTLSTSVAKTAGYAINAPSGYQYCRVVHCQITGTSALTHFNGIAMGNGLMEIDDVEMRFFTNWGVNVSGQSDHRINRLLTDNAVQAVSGILVTQTASLLLSNCNIIHSGNALDVSPAGTNTIPSIKGVNLFFDTSTNGIRLNPGSGFIYRSEFTNTWCSSHSNAGVLFAGANIDGISFENCEFYGNALGLRTDVAPAGDWCLVNSRVAGNSTAGISLIGGASHFGQIIACDIGPQAAFGANGTGILVAAGTYKGLRVDGTKCLGNTTNLNLGAVTLATGDGPNFGMTNSPGINPKGAVTTPSVPASTTVVTNTTGFRVTAYLKGGTITAISVNGVATGLAVATPIMLDPGGTIAVTYSVAFTWVWVAS